MSKKPATKTLQNSPQRKGNKVQIFFHMAHQRVMLFLERRPHRSFVRTRRRDYVRQLTIPGYVAFTGEVLRTLKRHQRTFWCLVGLYGFVIFALGGITNQDTYSQIAGLLSQSKSELGTIGFNTIGQAGLLLLSTYATGPGGLSADQQIYLGFALLLVWLTTVWLLREFLVGRKPRLRDGLYNAGAPIISSLALCGLLLMQLLPVGILAIAYGSLTYVGLAASGFGAMLFWVIATLITVLVLYWATSTIIALVVVTLPGMYPMQALKASGDLVVGRRLRIMYRMIWAQLLIVLSWAVIMIPIIIFDSWLKNAWQPFTSVPVVPFIAAVASAASSVLFAAYVYLLYRKVVDDDTPSA